VSLRPVTIEQFPGLDLRADPGESRTAIDLLNVTLEPGRVRSRDGSASFFATAAQPMWAGMHPITGSIAVHMLIASTGSPGVIYAVTQAGVLVASDNTKNYTAATPLSSAHIGTPSANYTYIGNANLTTLTRWDGAAWTFPAVLPATIPNVRAMGVSPSDNRLVIGNTDTVAFSDPGAPETFGANNFVRLQPGDGETVGAMCAYQNQLFVFKRSKFFVFYGNSTDSTGSPIFNYRTVDTGHGIGANFAAQMVAVGDDGVYFLANDGIYRTTGGSPVKISAPLDPFFNGAGANPFWQGGYFDWQNAHTQSRLMWMQDCLYVSVPVTGGVGSGIVFVYNRRLDAWSAWNLNTRALTAITNNSLTVFPLRLVYGGATSGMFRMDPSLGADAGTAIVSRYRLPFETYGTPGEKRIRETLIEGTGTPTVQWSRDWGSLTTGSAVTLGTSPAVAVGRQRLAIRGRAFSLQFGASSGAWAVNRVQPNLGEGVRGVEVTV
jgi:hypothetical protein